MNKMLRFLGIGLLGGSMLCSSAVGLAWAGEPTDKVRDTVNAVIAVLSDKTLQSAEQAQQRREKMR